MKPTSVPNPALDSAHRKLVDAYGVFGPSSNIPGELMCAIGNVHLDLLAVLRLLAKPVALDRDTRIAVRVAYENLMIFEETLVEVMGTELVICSEQFEACCAAIDGMREALEPYVDLRLRRRAHDDGWIDAEDVAAYRDSVEELGVERSS
ncbi:MAG: hypothetical protein H0V17_20965 [Deltaproteobacteria bacterium]|nr:hypothetical protein [Deltaproteobacteria bacterium]